MIYDSFQLPWENNYSKSKINFSIFLELFRNKKRHYPKLSNAFFI